jgi:drug/metabolite transporter (DMT)-like permease
VHAHISVPTMLFWRFVVSSIFLVCCLVLQDQPSTDRKEIVKAFLYGVFFYSGSALGYFFSSVYIGTGFAMVVFFIYPAIVIILNYVLYRQPIAPHYYLALFFIVSGLILLVEGQPLKGDVLGIGMGLLSAFSYAAYVVGSKKANISPVVSSLMVSLGCCVTSLVFAYAEGSFLVPHGADVWAHILGLGILCTALPIVLLLQALKYISAVKASILSVFEPVFVISLGVVLLGETITHLQLWGIGVVLLGALLTLVIPEQTALKK